MKTKNSEVIERLKEYQVEPMEEASLQQIIAAGKQLILQGRTQRLSLCLRLLNQVKYLSPLLWAAESMLIFLCVLVISHINKNTDITLALSTLSFLMVILGIVGFPELCKSFSCQMWELEQSCKYNLRQITALRLSVIGTFHLILVLVIALATSMQMSLPLWEIALYLLVPFNLSCIAAFFVLGFFRNRGKERLILPAGLGVAFFLFIATNRFSLYDRFAISVWTVAFLVTTVILINRIFHFLNRLEQGGAALCS